MQATGIKQLAFAGFMALSIAVGSVGSAVQAPQPAAAASVDPATYTASYTFSPAVLQWLIQWWVRPAQLDLWTKQYTETGPVGNYLGPSAKDLGCNADARSRGYAYGESYLKSWRVLYQADGLNYMSVEVTCRAYRDAYTAPVVH